jgi:hypothetical protein
MHTRRHTAYLREATTFACLLVENRLLRMAVALQQLQEAFLQARLMNRGVLTACRLWRELRREQRVGVRLFRLGQHLRPPDDEHLLAACRSWQEGEPPHKIQAELLDHLRRLAPDHEWNWEKAQRVGAYAGLAPETLPQLLRESRTDPDSASKH